jgi:NADH:ubiquinone oxidoreductase subunit E
LQQAITYFHSLTLETISFEKWEREMTGRHHGKKKRYPKRGEEAALLKSIKETFNGRSKNVSDEQLCKRIAEKMGVCARTVRRRAEDNGFIQRQNRLRRAPLRRHPVERPS